MRTDRYCLLCIIPEHALSFMYLQISDRIECHINPTKRLYWHFCFTYFAVLQHVCGISTTLGPYKVVSGYVSLYGTALLCCCDVKPFPWTHRTVFLLRWRVEYNFPKLYCELVWNPKPNFSLSGSVDFSYVFNIYIPNLFSEPHLKELRRSYYLYVCFVSIDIVCVNVVK